MAISSLFSLRGGIEEEQVRTREKIAVVLEKLLLDDVLDAPGSKGRPVSLIPGLFSQKGHGTIQVMQGQRFNAVDAVIPAPPVTGAIGPGNEQAMQNRQEDGPLHFELELPTLQQAAEDLVDAQLLSLQLFSGGAVPRIRNYGERVAFTNERCLISIIISGADSERRRHYILLHHFIHFFNGRAFREAAGCIQNFSQ